MTPEEIQKERIQIHLKRLADEYRNTFGESLSVELVAQELEKRLIADKQAFIDDYLRSKRKDLSVSDIRVAIDLLKNAEVKNVRRKRQ